MSEPFRIRLLEDLAGKRQGDILTVPGPGITEDDALHFLARRQAEKLSPNAFVALEPPTPVEASAAPPAIAPEAASAPTSETVQA